MEPDHKLLWDTLTKEQIDVITIFIVNYYDENEVEEGAEAFKAVLLMNVVDAATYLTSQQYLIFRSISDYQKLAIYLAFYLFEALNSEDAKWQYDNDDTVSAVGYSYDVYILHCLFAYQNANITNFKFFNTQNNN